MASTKIAFYICYLLIISPGIHIYVYYMVFAKLLQENYLKSLFQDVPIWEHQALKPLCGAPFKWRPGHVFLWRKYHIHILKSRLLKQKTSQNTKKCRPVSDADVINKLINKVYLLDLSTPYPLVDIFQLYTGYLNYTSFRGPVVAVNLQLPMQSVPITTDVVSSNLDQCEVYNIM